MSINYPSAYVLQQCKRDTIQHSTGINQHSPQLALATSTNVALAQSTAVVSLSRNIPR